MAIPPWAAAHGTRQAKPDKQGDDEPYNKNLGLVLVHLESKKFSRFLVTSNLVAHA